MNNATEVRAQGANLGCYHEGSCGGAWLLPFRDPEYDE